MAIYLDHNATTPVAPEVLDAMRPVPRASASATRRARTSTAPRRRRAVERARAQVAALLGCEPDEIVFTASGSEADNLAIKGVALARLGERDHVITSAIEHPPCSAPAATSSAASASG